MSVYVLPLSPNEHPSTAQESRVSGTRQSPHQWGPTVGHVGYLEIAPRSPVIGYGSMWKQKVERGLGPNRRTVVAIGQPIFDTHLNPRSLQGVPRYGRSAEGLAQGLGKGVGLEGSKSKNSTRDNDDFTKVWTSISCFGVC